MGHGSPRVHPSSSRRPQLWSAASRSASGPPPAGRAGSEDTVAGPRRRPSRASYPQRWLTIDPRSTSLNFQCVQGMQFGSLCHLSCLWSCGLCLGRYTDRLGRGDRAVVLQVAEHNGLHKRKGRRPSAPTGSSGQLGVGGMGRVYRVLGEGDQELALKILGGGRAKDAALRLRREFRAIARLDHPQIVKVPWPGGRPRTASTTTRWSWCGAGRSKRRSPTRVISGSG